jgi:hypothetical protein
MRKFMILLGSSAAIAASIACSSEPQTDGSSGTTNGSSGTTGSSGTSGDAEDPPVPAATCQDACKAKATECSAPANQIDAICSGICGGSLTAGQIECLKSSACAKLAPDEFKKTCPKRTSSSSSSSSGSSSSSSGSSSSSSGSSSSSSGSSGGVKFPTSITLTGKLDRAPEKNGNQWVFEFSDYGVSVSPAISGDLPGLRAGAVVVSGQPAGCKAQLLLQFERDSGTGRPYLGGQAVYNATGTECDSFFNGLKTGNLEISVTNAPYQNSSVKCNATIKMTR